RKLVRWSAGFASAVGRLGADNARETATVRPFGFAASELIRILGCALAHPDNVARRPEYLLGLGWAGPLRHRSLLPRILCSTACLLGHADPPTHQVMAVFGWEPW